MSFTHLMPAFPEIFLSIMIMVILVVDLFLKEKQRWLTYGLSQLTLIGCALLTFNAMHDMPIVLFDQQLMLTQFSAVAQLFILLAGFLIFVYSRTYCFNEGENSQKGEYYLLALLSILGAMILVSASSLLTLYLGLELMSLPLYALVAIKRNKHKGAEAAMKYFVMGALASGLLLYGMSMIYGITHTIQIADIVTALKSGAVAHMTLLLFSMVFIIAAIAFKLGAVPFHMWVPDVYEGAPMPITTFLATIPKLAAFGLFIRLVSNGLVSLTDHWSLLLMILAILSLAIGNILAVVQKSIKRMLGYSTIANIGFVLLGLSSGTLIGYQYAFFYIVTYILMSAGAFGLLTLLSSKGHKVCMIEDLSGLNKTHSGLALLMMLLLLSMAGIPPLVGFDAKLFIVNNMIELHRYGLALFTLIISVVGAYYYLHVVKVMYFDEPKIKWEKITLSKDGLTVITINGLAMLVLGVFPAGLLALCSGVF